MNYKLARNFFLSDMWLRLIFQFNNRIVWRTKKAEESTSTQAHTIHMVVWTPVLEMCADDRSHFGLSWQRAE